MKLPDLAILIFGCAYSLAAAPSITGVTNAASSLPPGLPGSGIAQGAILTVFGAGLGPVSLQQATTFPLPSSQGLGGTTVRVTVGAVSETCILLYTVASQVGAILPSVTPVGAGTLTVSYQGASTSIAIQVLAAGFGTFTLNEDGSGPAVVTDLNYVPITLFHPAHAGDILILWGTGLGAVSGDETQPPQQVDLNTGVQVFVENQPAKVLYGGRSGDAGLDQINFAVPTGISGGCKTSIAVFVKSTVGNVTSMAVAPAGQSTCGDPAGALTTANLQTAVANGSLNIATVELSRVGTGDDKFTADVASYPLSALVHSYDGVIAPSVGSCVSYTVLGSALVITDPTPTPKLDAGPTLSVSGPAGTKTVTEGATGTYSGTLATSPSVYLQPGSYSLTNGAGSAAVSGFNWGLTLPPPITLTNFPSTINRSQDFTLTWAGGGAFSVVTIFGFAGVPVTATTNSYVEFVCNATASAGAFTIPSNILSLLPANAYGSPGVPGAGIQVGGVTLNQFTAGGAPGIDAGTLNAFTTSGGVVKIQ